MDPLTVQHYTTAAAEHAAAYEAAAVPEMHTLMLRHFAPGARLLEIGCGSGRDAAFLLAHGRDVTATDASEGMIRAAAMAHPELAGRLVCAAFPLPARHALLQGQPFDGVYAVAAIMHVPDEELFEFAFQTKSLLRPDGTLLLSFSTERSGLSDDRDPVGRLFRERPPGEVRLLFERLGFRLLEQTTNPDGLGRTVRWHTLMLILADGAGDSPVDQIETIINRDRKDATYKLALLRALCDLAQTEYRQAVWHPDDTVSVPLGLVAEKWLLYYWPIIEADLGQDTVRIPQKRGLEVNKPLAFRKPLRRLVEHCARHGGLDAFFADFRGGGLAADAAVLADTVLNTISSTIVSGPVTYAGGAIDDERPFFWHTGAITRKGRCSTPDGLTGALGAVHMRGEVWRELALVGHWISEAIVLRWAELTHEISGQRVSVAEAVDRLLVLPNTARGQQRLRAFYAGRPALQCVWTEVPLRRRFEIDHVIPFSLWHNNDLWNLMPASRHANQAKRDRLASREQLRGSRDLIIGYWQAVRGEQRQRFDHELRRALVGGETVGRNWEKVAFMALSETIESLACQRGIPRWPDPTAAVVSFGSADSSRAEAAQSATPYAVLAESATTPVLLSYSDISGREFRDALPLVAELAAGTPLNGFLIDDLTRFRECQWLEVPVQVCGPRRFAVRIAGDSMEPTLSMQDLVVFEYHRTPRQDRQVAIMAEFPSDAAAGECAVKRVTQDAQAWVFGSDNRACPARRIPKVENAHPILGIAVFNLSRNCRVR